MPTNGVLNGSRVNRVRLNYGSYFGSVRRLMTVLYPFSKITQTSGQPDALYGVITQVGPDPLAGKVTPVAGRPDPRWGTIDPYVGGAS
jgi:hypothetical protein